MSSYSKQMMDQAAPWLKSNPDPKNPLILCPGSDVSRAGDVSELIRAGRNLAKRVRKAIAKTSDPKKLVRLQQCLVDLEPQLEAGYEEYDKREEVVRGLEKNEAALARALIPERSATKYNFNSLETDTLSRITFGRWFINWAREGYNVFELSQDFTVAMLLTDPSAVDFERIALPFEGLLLTIPSGLAVGANNCQYTKIHLSNSNAYLENDEVIDEKIIQIQATDGENVLELNILYSELTAGGWGAIEALPTDDDNTVADPEDHRAAQTIRHIVFNTLSYIHAIPDSVQPVERERAKRKDKKVVATPKIFDVGRTVRIDSKLIAAARAGFREVAFQLKCRFIVRGHYRDQPYGPGRQLRREQWIAPHWKGPEEGAKIVHTYKPECL